MSVLNPVLRGIARFRSLLFDFVHAGLLLSGLVIVLAGSSAVAGHPAARNAFQSVRDTLFGNAADEDADVSPVSESIVLPDELRVALGYVSRRYRVSGTALAPVFEAAYESGREFKLDPLLIVAVIGVESGFNPFAESVMGAQGLMQVIPKYHPEKLPEDADARALFDPTINVHVGAQVLREAINRNGGLVAGLQQFAGASDDPEQGYATKVLAEKQRLENVVRRRKA